MRFDNGRVLLTPPEAAFIEEACRFHEVGTLPEGVKVKIMAGIIEWANSLSPPVISMSLEGEGRYPFLRVNAERRWKESDGEVVDVELTGPELTAVKELAGVAVTEAKAAASNVGASVDDSSEAVRQLFPEDDMELDDSNADSLKDYLFELELKKIHVGQAVVSAISEFQT